MAKLIRTTEGQVRRESPGRHSPRNSPKGSQLAPKKSKAGVALGKAKFLKVRADGLTIKDTMREIGYSDRTYANWRDSDPEFRQATDRLTARINGQRLRDQQVVPDFPEFAEKYLGLKLHRHQLQWFDLLEGRDPRDLHPSQVWLPGRDTHIIVNTPPEHAKTTTITVAYTTWRIVKNPDELITIVSKTREMAGDFLSAIKEYLTNPIYAELQDTFGPESGYEKACTEWSAYRIRFGPKMRTQVAKDPTVQAVGVAGQIYGKRATLVILDDCIDTTNYQQVDDQFNWISRMVGTRVGAKGKILVIGTRVAPIDLYKELRNPDRYAPGVKPAWTYFAQPAVEDFAEDPKDWVTLWPRSNQPQVGDDSEPDEDGTYEMWSGQRLKDRRDVVGEHTWLQGYQQQDLQEVAIFPRADVEGCINRSRKSGIPTPSIPQQLAGNPTLDDLHVIAGLDPASTGKTAAVVYGVRLGVPPNGKGTHGRRYVLNVHNQANMTPGQVRRLMIDWTRTYRIKEWRIESVLLSNWITQDTEIVTELANEGCIIAPHQTSGRNKWDPLAGVMGMAGLFSNWSEDRNLIELPSIQYNENVRALVDQLITFFPETKAATDCLMALWFAEIRARDLIRTHQGSEDDTHVKTWWDSEHHERTRRSVHLSMDGQVELTDNWWDY